MKILIIRSILLSAFLLFLLNDSVLAQSRQRLRELEKKEQQRNEEEQQSNEAGKKRHYNIQSKSTKKEMKRLKKISRRHNTNRKAPFWKRMKFGKRKRR